MLQLADDVSGRTKASFSKNISKSLFFKKHTLTLRNKVLLIDGIKK